MLLGKPSVLAVCLSVGGESSCEKGQGAVTLSITSRVKVLEAAHIFKRK